MPGSHRIVVDGAFGWLDLFPDLEVVERWEGRNVIAGDGFGHTFHLFPLREIQQNVLRRAGGLGEIPDAPEIWPVWHHAALRPSRVGERPAVLRHLRRVTFRHGPG